MVKIQNEIKVQEKLIHVEEEVDQQVPQISTTLQAFG
jgi:hypothetical protein